MSTPASDRMRVGSKADVPALCAIEALSNASPWTADAFEVELERSVSTVWVAESDGAVVGFAVYWVVVDEAHILNFAVAPSYRRRGLGRRMLDRVLARAEREGAAFMMLEVRASNAPAQALYAQRGFAEIGRRAGYYQDNGETAVVMGRTLGDEAGD